MKKKMEAFEKFMKKTNANDDEDVDEDNNISKKIQMKETITLKIISNNNLFLWSKKQTI